MSRFISSANDGADGGGGGGAASGGKEAPAFLNSSETTVVTSVGQTAYLHCGVDRLGDRAVIIPYHLYLYIY